MDALLALAGFTFVASITPGPNNLMLAASGVGFGLKRTVPHVLGVCAGFAVLVLACGLGIGALLMQSPAMATGLKMLGSCYLVYLAWRLGSSLTPGSGNARARPLSFAEAAAFQFANPKAWLMGITAAAVFLPGLGSDWQALAVLCLVVCAVNFPCVSSWAVMGAAIRARLQDAVWRRRFSAVMIVLTLYAAASIWI